MTISDFTREFSVSNSCGAIEPCGWRSHRHVCQVRRILHRRRPPSGSRGQRWRLWHPSHQYRNHQCTRFYSQGSSTSRRCGFLASNLFRPFPPWSGVGFGSDSDGSVSLFLLPIVKMMVRTLVIQLQPKLQKILAIPLHHFQ